MQNKFSNGFVWVSPFTSDLSFIFCHENANADSPMYFHVKKIQNFKTQWHKILRLADKVDISDHNGKPKPFSIDCLGTETKKSKNKCSLLNFLRDIKYQVFTL